MPTRRTNSASYVALPASIRRSGAKVDANRCPVNHISWSFSPDRTNSRVPCSLLADARRFAGLEDTVLQGVAGRFRPAMGADLGVDCRHMAGNGVDAEAEPGSDLLVALAVREEAQDVDLP